jgi:hypothetical protein
MRNMYGVFIYKCYSLPFIYCIYIILVDVTFFKCVIFLFFEVLVIVRNNSIQTDPSEEFWASRPKLAYKEV